MFWKLRCYSYRSMIFIIIASNWDANYVRKYQNISQIEPWVDWIFDQQNQSVTLKSMMIFETYSSKTTQVIFVRQSSSHFDGIRVRIRLKGFLDLRIKVKNLQSNFRAWHLHISILFFLRTTFRFTSKYFKYLSSTNRKESEKMKLRIRYPRSGKFVTIIILLILSTIYTLLYNWFQMNNQYFCIIPSPLLTTSNNTTSINTINARTPV